MAQGAIIGQQPEIPQPYDIGDIKISTKDSLGEDWVLCKGQLFDGKQYPLVKDNVLNSWNIFQNDKQNAIDYSGINGSNPQCWMIDGDYVYCVYNKWNESTRGLETYIKRAKLLSDLSKFETVYTISSGYLLEKRIKKVGNYFCLLGESSTQYYGYIIVSKDGKNWKEYNRGSRGYPVNVCHIGEKYYVAYYDDYGKYNQLYCLNDFESYPFVSEAEMTGIALKNHENFDIGVVNDYLIVYTKNELYSAKNPTISTSFTKISKIFSDNEVRNLYQPFAQMPDGALYFFTNKEIYKVRTNSLTLENDKLYLYENINIHNEELPNITPYSIIPYNKNIIIYGRSDSFASDEYYGYYAYDIKNKTFRQADREYFNLEGGTDYSFCGVYANEQLGNCYNYYLYNDHPYFIYFPINFPYPLSQDTNTFIKVK